MTFFRDNIEKLTAYQPGEQPPAGAKVIKLNTNENPYPPSPAAMDVLRAVETERLRRYPDPMAGHVRKAAAEVLGFEPEWILVGNGSDELLTMLMRSCAEPARKVAYATPTYVLYRTLVQIQAAQAVEVPYDEDYNLPVGQLIAAKAAVTLVATPNSPSGTVAHGDELVKLAAGCGGLLVVDEAYVDFADHSAIDLVRKFQNVVILRTLSKGYSLAGLRVGFAIAQPPVIVGLVKVKDSYNVDAVACTVAAAALRDQAHKNANAQKVRVSRARLAGALDALGFRVWPSQANFLLARPPAGDAKRFYQILKDRGILVRYFQQPRLDDKLRITVGTDAQNDALVAAMKEILAP